MNKQDTLVKQAAMVKRNRAWKRLFQIIDRVADRAPTSAKTEKQEEEEIAQMIKDYREEDTQGRGLLRTDNE